MLVSMNIQIISTQASRGRKFQREKCLYAKKITENWPIELCQHFAHVSHVGQHWMFSKHLHVAHVLRATLPTSMPWEQSELDVQYSAQYSALRHSAAAYYSVPQRAFLKVLLRTSPCYNKHYKELQIATSVLLCTTRYCSVIPSTAKVLQNATTYILLHTTKYCKVLQATTMTTP